MRCLATIGVAWCLVAAMAVVGPVSGQAAVPDEGACIMAFVVVGPDGDVCADADVAVRFGSGEWEKAFFTTDGTCYCVGEGSKVTIDVGAPGLCAGIVELTLVPDRPIQQVIVHLGEGLDPPWVECFPPMPAPKEPPRLGPGPANDLCAGAIGPLAVPSITPGTTDGATIDSEFPFCGTGITSPGVWYTVIGTGNTMTASTCGPLFDYDTKVSVYCVSCDMPTCVDGNDDDCTAGASSLLSTVTWCSQAGAEYLVLVHGFGGGTGQFELFLDDDGMPCTGAVECAGVGACCLPDGTCVDGLTQADCEFQGGAFQGVGAPCDGTVTYTGEDCADPFEDISGTGTPGPDGDDAGAVVPIGFTFEFYGVPFTEIGMSTNGYLTFGPDLTDFSNDPIPTVTDPNALIAPLWDDLVVDAEAATHYQTLGTEPNRRFIAQWTNVREFGSEDRSTFQAILFEDTNCIEFRYGPVSPESFPNDYTVGIENLDGTNGLAFDASVIMEGDCLSACPVGGPIDCTPTVGACCQCDGAVQFCTLETEEDCALLGGVFLGVGSGCDPMGGVIAAGAAPGLPIPDDDGAGVSHTVSIALTRSDPLPVLDVDLTVEIEHTWIGDLCVALSKDGGPEYFLIQRMNFDGPCDGTGCCGCSSNDLLVTLDDEATDAIEDQCGAGGGLLTGTFRPDPDALSVFDGIDATGDWTIRVVDSAGGDTGTLVAWTLAVTVAAGPPPCEVAVPDQCVVELPLDIKPGSCPNPLNRGSNGVIPVGLLGTMDFDITQVDVATVVIGRADGVGGTVGPNEGPPGPHPVFSDVGTPFMGEPCGCHGMGPDGILDLMMHFRTQDVVDALVLDGLSPGDLVELVVSGFLSDGRAFRAHDCVVLVPPGQPMRSLAVSATATGAWIDVTPLDLLTDGGGFADFQRTYLESTVVTLTASATHDGRTFTGWRLADGRIVRGHAIPLVVTGGAQSVEAIYAELPPVDMRPVPIGGGTRPLR